MTFRQFIIKNIKSHINKYLMYFFCTSFFMTIFFIVTSLWFISEFNQQSGDPIKQMMIVSLTITFIFSFLFIIYMHQLFITNRLGEFGVLLSYGMLLRDIKKMIIIENIIIYIGSVINAFFCGSIFSRLFFLISMRLLSLEDITYHLSYKTFILTAIIFIPLFCIVVIKSSIKLSKLEINQLIKEKNRNDNHKKVTSTHSGILGNFISLQASRNFLIYEKNHIIVGLIGIIIIILAGITLYNYTKNILSEDVLNLKILTLTGICIFGMYLSTNFFSSFLIWLKQKNHLKYKNLILLTEFTTSLKNNKKTLFVLMLLSFGSVFFLSVSYSVFTSKYIVAEREQIYDLEYQVIEELPIGEQIDLEYLANKNKVRITKQKTINYIYVEAENLIKYEFRNKKWLTVFNVEEFNKLFNTNYQVSQSEAQQVIFESNLNHQYKYFNENNIILKQKDNKITFKRLKNDNFKCFNRYLFPLSTLLLVNPKDYNELYSQANSFEKGTIHLVNLNKWRESKSFHEEYYKLYTKEKKQFIKNNEKEFKLIIDRYGYDVVNPKSKYAISEELRKIGAFSLFLLSFISLLFIMTIFMTLYFKVFSDYDDDKERLLKLVRIGITTKQKKEYISSKLGLLVLIPIVVGSFIGCAWSFSFNFNRLIEIECHSIYFLKNSIYISTGFILIMYLYYRILKHVYFEAVNN